MYDIGSYDKLEVVALLDGWGQPRFRGAQLYRWIAGGATDFEQMTNLPKELRERLAEECSLHRPTVVTRQTGSDGTVKLLWQMNDGNTVESVVMRYKHGTTVCISTQVGCRMGCTFCASTHGGLVRNLTAAEMLNQVRFSGEECGVAIDGVVLMGIGEPLDNFDNMVRFLELVSDQEGLGIGMRHVSLSTCGFSDGIERLGELNLQLTLSVSLHAPDDETRSRLMPVARATTVRGLVERCNAYRRKTGRRISYEYLLADGVNDSVEQAELLARLLRGSDGHVNLIPLNRVDESQFAPSSDESVQRFRETLERRGVNVTVRRKMGADIDAACGQLRRKR